MNTENTLLELEIALLDDKKRKSKQFLNDILADDFLEIGSSGKIYSKKDVLTVLHAESSSRYDITHFEVKELATNIMQTRYTVRQINNAKNITITSSRSSLWRFSDGKWQIFFHQGTIIQE